MLPNNDYPLEFINQNIRNRRISLKRKQNNNNDKFKNLPWIQLPFLINNYKKLSAILKQYNIVDSISKKNS